MTESMRTVAILAMATLLLLAAIILVAPQPARADNCEVTELAGVIALVSGKPYEEPGEEDGKPTCVVLRGAVYPIIGCNSPADCQQNGLDPQICVPFVGPPPYDGAPGDVSCK